MVVCGITVKTFSENLHNNIRLTHNFWHIAKHLLNMLLFFIAGALYGKLFVDKYSKLSFVQEAKIILWTSIIFLIALVILFILVLLFYPATSRISINQSCQEVFFLSYSGLRSAMSIALAVFVYEGVQEETT